jgi:hypothetical protein
MAYRALKAAPASRVSEDRRGREVGRFCKSCGSIYSPLASRHKGKPVYGKDHVASPCSHEGDDFAAGEAWWEPAVEMLPAPEADAPVTDEA